MYLIIYSFIVVHGPVSIDLGSKRFAVTTERKKGGTDVECHPSRQPFPV